jgi:hypothetical protein
MLCTPPHCINDVYTRRDQLVICGQYLSCVFSPYYRKVKGERSMWLVEDRTASTDLTVVIETAVCVCLSVCHAVLLPWQLQRLHELGSKPRCVYTACLYTYKGKAN